MNFRFPAFNAFKLVYWVIAIAMAQHTAWGAATTMQGAQPVGDALGWWLQGYAFTAGIDFSMVMVATKIRSGATAPYTLRIWRLQLHLNWYIVAFAFVALVSAYFQLLYSWQHATPLSTSGGVAAVWVARLQDLIDARVVIAPLALPMVAILYTLGGIGKGGETQRTQRNVRNEAQPVQSERAAVATPVRVHVDGLPAPTQRALPDGLRRYGSDGNLIGYTCSGCGKELSISGWSRHKNSCKAYQERAAVNGSLPAAPVSQPISSNGHREE